MNWASTGNSTIVNSPRHLVKGLGRDCQILPRRPSLFRRWSLLPPETSRLDRMIAFAKPAPISASSPVVRRLGKLERAYLRVHRRTIFGALAAMLLQSALVLPL